MGGAGERWHDGAVTAPQPTRARVAPYALLAVVLLTALAFAPGARAATKTVTLTNQGPSPTSITIAVGDVVKFDNQSNVDHTITSAKTWSYKRTVAAGSAASTAPFTAAGTYAYSDDFILVAIPQQVNGSIVAKGAAATASPTPKPTASPTPRPTSTPSPTRSPTATPSASPSPSTGTGTAVGPGLGTGVLTSAQPTPSDGPNPDIAAPGSPSPSTSAGPVIAYGEKAAVVQGSPHRFGLPAALAVVLMGGVLSLILRLLLSLPEARRSSRE